MKTTGGLRIFAAAALMALLGSGAVRAEQFAPQQGPAQAELLGAAPGASKTPDGALIAAPAPAGLVFSAAADPADPLIRGLIADAERQGSRRTAELFRRLLDEGTRGEKQALLDATDGPYAFPARFAPQIVTVGLCEWITKTFCWMSCLGTGVERECHEECRDIIVKSCE